ncbi:hypothetical protein [Streptomyces sp. 1-11]|uniref:hypothetical protein n=1 Tax=Streptomyces sp. 1-11 TaxID=2590549 RepID=UPI00117264F8|nr:hypothetical protein [Streptomyces sp. 1-11]GEJ98229.1 hypothetical protein TNCT1_05060 [Streptomyces sp. 1-11]
MSLVELIARAGERGLAVSGLACLDRCVPLLGGDDEVLRPLWASVAEGSDWGVGLEKARGALGPEDSDEDEAARLAHRMLDEAPAERTTEALRAWADACSVASLRVHRLLDPAADGADGAGDVEAGRTGDVEDLPPLVAAELRRQTVVLELVAEHGANGLRRALDVSVEGRRVLSAVVSRRARSRG